MGLFCFAVVWCFSAPLYMSCVFRGSVVSSLFWLFIKLFFIDKKKHINLMFISQYVQKNTKWYNVPDKKKKRYVCSS